MYILYVCDGCNTGTSALLDMYALCAQGNTAFEDEDRNIRQHMSACDVTS